MALANFFGKSAMAASQALQGFDPATLRQKLELCVVGIAFDHDAAKSSEGKTAVGLAVNLLSRFYPRIAIVDLTRRDRDLTEALSFRGAINPAIEILDDVNHVTAMLVVGSTRACAPAVFYLGSDGWIAKLSSKDPVGSGNWGMRLAQEQQLASVQPISSGRYLRRSWETAGTMTSLSRWLI